MTQFTDTPGIFTVSPCTDRNRPIQQMSCFRKYSTLQQKMPILYIYHIESLVQDCSNSSALAMELLQSCTKPSIYHCIEI